MVFELLRVQEVPVEKCIEPDQLQYRLKTDQPFCILPEDSNAAIWLVITLIAFLQTNFSQL